MLTIMEMSTGRCSDDLTAHYDEDVLNANWTEPPRLEPQLQLVAVPAQQPGIDPALYLNAFYAAQE